MKISKVVRLGVLVWGAIALPLFAQDSASNSESERLKKLEDAVRQLQQRNAQLESEVHDLKANARTNGSHSGHSRKKNGTRQ